MSLPTADFRKGKRLGVLFIVALFVSAFQLASVAWAADRPNIVWIIADDLSPELGCYGYQGVNTPNVDRLALEGAKFTRAFSTAPVCSTSRSAFITGVYQTSTGTHHHRTLDKQPLPKPVVPITDLLRNAGYFVCNSNSSMSRAGKGDYNFTYEGKMYDAVDWSTGPTKRKVGQPFFAQVQIHEPHRDFVVAKNPERAQTVKIPSYYPEHPITRVDWSNYLETIDTMDRKIGVVLDRLEKEGQLDNTAVFFFGDHGRPHYRDKQWLYDGGLRVPLIVRWPAKFSADSVRDELLTLMDVSATTLSIAGVKVPDWMDGRDISASDFQGHTYVYGARDRSGSTLDRARSVRTTRFKYIRNFHPERPFSQHSGYKVLQYPGFTLARVLHQRGELTGAPSLFWVERRPKEELYDLESDPEELNNLAGDESYQETLVRLRTQLDRWMVDSDDKGQYAEQEEQSAVDSSNRWFEGRMKKRGFTRDYDPEAYLMWWEKELGLKQD